MGQSMIREAVGVFDDEDDLDAAIQELESTSFPRHEISVLGSPQELEEKFGNGAVAPVILEDNSETPRSFAIRPEEKTIGAAAFVGILAYICGCVAVLMVSPASGLVSLSAIAGGSVFGAAVGCAIVYMIHLHMKQRADKQIAKGGLILWVRTNDPQREQDALDILRKHGGRDVHVHGMY